MPARILIIEDNPANLDLMTYLLSAFGHTPLGARDGEEGLAAAGREAPDLIVCDVQLPAMDGYEPEEIIGKANSVILHTPEDAQAGKHREILELALCNGKWEGMLDRVRKSGEQFTAGVVITPRCDTTGRAVGFLLISLAARSRWC